MLIGGKQNIGRRKLVHKTECAGNGTIREHKA